MRVFVGTDPVTGSPRQITRTVQAKTQRQAQQILDALRDNVATAACAMPRTAG
jgi:mitochondrial fission protein ELM1